MNKVTKNDIFQRSFTRILLTTQQCIQDYSNNLRETDCKESLRASFSDKKYMCKNIPGFLLTKGLNL